MSMVNKWIMVVDSETDVLHFIDMLLRRQSMAVIKARNAELALHLVKSMRPDAFIVDVSLPDMSGIDLCRTLRSTPHTASIPVIILSAHDDAGLREQARAAGANEFISQRALPEDLPGKIANVLANANGHSPRGNGVSAISGL